MDIVEIIDSILIHCLRACALVSHQWFGRVIITPDVRFWRKNIKYDKISFTKKIFMYGRPKMVTSMVGLMNDESIRRSISFAGR